MLFCGQKSQGDKPPWLVFGTFSPGCVDQGLRVQRLHLLVRCRESSVSVAQVRGWRRISQPMATRPLLQVTQLSNNPKRHCSFLGLLHYYHHTTHSAHCSSRSTARRCRRLAESQGPAKFATASLSEPSLRFSPDLTSTASHTPRTAEHLGRLEQKKTSASLVLMTAVAASDGSTQRGHKQTLPGLGASPTFPLPGSWSPIIAIHARCPQHGVPVMQSHQLAEPPTRQAPSFLLL